MTRVPDDRNILPRDFSIHYSRISSKDLELLIQNYQEKLEEKKAAQHNPWEVFGNSIITFTTKMDRNSEFHYLYAKYLFFSGKLKRLIALYSLKAHPGTKYLAGFAQLFRGESKDALAKIKQAYEQVTNEGDDFVAIEALGALSFCYSVLRQYDEVEKLQNEAQNVFEESLVSQDAWIGQALSLVDVRYAYTLTKKRGTPEKAVSICKTAYNASKTDGNRFLTAMALMVWGQALEYQNMSSLALEKHDEALELVQQINAHHLESMLLNRVGIALASAGNSEKAYNFFERSFQKAVSSGAIWLEIGPLGNLVSYQKALGDLEGALESLNRICRVAETFGDNNDLTYGLLGLADVFRELGDYKSAEWYYKQGIHLAVRSGLLSSSSHPKNRAN